MTEKDIRAMYDKMSLSEERLSELEKRLDGCFDREPENIHDFDDDGLMQFDQEYKPAPRRRSPLIAAVSAAAVVLVAGGVTAAFRTHANLFTSFFNFSHSDYFFVKTSR